MPQIHHKELTADLIRIDQQIANTKVLAEAFGDDEATKRLLDILDNMQQERREVVAKLRCGIGC